MPQAFYDVLQTSGFYWLLATIGAAGLIRGFTGFGTALIFVPVAAQFLPLGQIILVISLIGIGSMITLVPQAWHQADRSEVGLLALAAAITTPFGIYLLGQIDGLILRWIVAVVVAVTLVAVVSGWRYHGRLGVRGRLAIGGASGIFGGMTGLTGPVVIVFYLANARDITKVRANTILFLAALDVVILANLALDGPIAAQTLWLAACLSLPYLAGIFLGKAAFAPHLERVYRVAAYSVIGLAVLTSLPVFD